MGGRLTQIEAEGSSDTGHEADAVRRGRKARPSPALNLQAKESVAMKTAMDYSTLISFVLDFF